jgi:hypothetical protein
MLLPLFCSIIHLAVLPQQPDSVVLQTRYVSSIICSLRPTKAFAQSVDRLIDHVD